jgi:hypothetical protein
VPRKERGSVVAVRGEVGNAAGPFIAAGKAVTQPNFELEELRAMAVGGNIPPLTRPVRPRPGFAVGVDAALWTRPVGQGWWRASWSAWCGRRFAVALFGGRDGSGQAH